MEKISLDFHSAMKDLKMSLLEQTSTILKFEGGEEEVSLGIYGNISGNIDNTIRNEVKKIRKF